MTIGRKAHLERSVSLDYKYHPSADFEDIQSLKKAQAEKQAQALREGLRHHDYLYYVKSQPEISDSLYDKLFKRSQQLEQAFPELRSDLSPTLRVGAEPLSKPYSCI